MIIIAYVSYPTESGKEMATRFLEAPQVPDYMTMKGPYVSASMADGILVNTYYELDNSQLAEGLKFLGNYMATYFGIPGFTYQYKPYFEIEEALKTIGM
jgi:hypothetical protein